MQSEQWAVLRESAGWSVLEPDLGSRKVFAYRKTTPAGGIVYMPGFVPERPEDLRQVAAQLKGNMVCKVETCAPYDEKIERLFKEAGWKRARNVQYHHTVLLDLTQSEDDLWMGMKARGRQEVNYARRDGVVIERAEVNGTNLEQMHALLETTSKRKAFGIREKTAVLAFWKAFHEAGQLESFFAKQGKDVIAGAIFITNGQTAWYKDAGSLPRYHKLFGPRLLLWEAALYFKKQGLKSFDLGGVPGEDELETSSMKGVYTFKTAYTREVTRMMPSYELPLKPLLYPMWQKIEPTALKTQRKLSAIKGKLRS